MYHEEGVGLAAIQVGRPLQILTMDISESRDSPTVFINPKIIEHSGSQICQEGCLSLPGIYAEVSRFLTITVSWTDEQATSNTHTFDGFEAVCLQHEMDHLKGVLFVDHLSQDMQKRAKQMLSEKTASKEHKFSLSQEGKDIKALSM